MQLKQTDKMTKNLLLILTILTFLSCGNESDKMIYKTKGGEFASQPGNFIADFPTKPNYSAIANQIGLDTFQIHLSRSTSGPNKMFTIEYLAYPDHMIKSMTDQHIYSHGLTTNSNKMKE